MVLSSYVFLEAVFTSVPVTVSIFGGDTSIEIIAPLTSTLELFTHHVCYPHFNHYETFIAQEPPEISSSVP